MGYTNSPMVVCTMLSPNNSGKRNHSIDRITPHCVVGQCTAEGLGGWFGKTSTQASSNYGIDKDGRVGMYVEEKNRSWCSSSSANDQRAITIECASEKTKPYEFRAVVYQRLIELCIDICQRNGKDKLIWLGDKDKTLSYEPKSNEMILTVHRWFANKSCPGDWMYARMGDLADKVTVALGGSSEQPVVPISVNLKKGDSGEAVKTMQTMLIACGYDCGKTGADGAFGANTLAAVKAFQKAAGVDVDGIYGPITKAALEKAYAEKSSGGSAGKGTQASVLKDLSEKDAIAKVGALFTEDQKKSGIQASVSLAQFILESGYGKSELAQNANNLFGMKCSLSGNTWSGSAWDGKSKYTKQTKEQHPDGSYETITADFRKYPCIEDSIADHSAYLLGAMNGKKLRYDGLKGCTDYKQAIQIIKDGGYATSINYVSNLCSIVERWNLTQYDVKESGETEVIRWYRVRKTWEDSKSQKGAYKILDNAKKCADQNPGYKVFDADGKVVYEPKAEETASDVPFLVKVSISDLNIRKGPGTDYECTGKFTGIGVFTIVEVKSGKGSSAGWGRLKSGAGWISLVFAKRV